ncbi:hypothetical protein T07_8893 [Trichinella nelsoni]|uniref:Uncharacterized protein n=1 Tax=Trichinella nelsoni TaxID=6336 RepID=A0A0V0RR57_9BILA|nr:hypothetical protein T07_8893 [Trichinella nelsoni]
MNTEYKAQKDNKADKMRKKMLHWQWQCEIKVQVKESAFRQLKQLSLTRLFSAESLGFPRSMEGERALCLPKEQGRVCTHPCLREGSFTLQNGAHFLVSPSSTCIKYFKSHSGHVCHFAELIYARLLSVCLYYIAHLKL